MSSRSCPWQHEWKRPLWQKPNKGSEESSTIAQDYDETLLGPPVCSTSARLSYEEVQKRNWFSSGTAATNNNNGNTVSSETNVHENYTPTQAPPLVTPQESLDLDFLGDGTLMEDDKNDDFVLTVTLFSSSSTTKKDTKRSRHRQTKERQEETVIGDIILLEVIQTSADDQGRVKRKKSRLLRWPGSVLRETVTGESEEEEEEEEEDNLTTKSNAVEEEAKEETKSSGDDQFSPPQQQPKSKNWLEKMMFPWWGDKDNAKKQKSKSQSTTSEKHLGLVSVSLCRKPPQDGNSSPFDALDVVNMMSLGLLSNVEPGPLVVANDNDSAVSLNKNNETENQEQDKGEEGHGAAYNNNNNNGSQLSIPDLVLCCLTMDGRIHFYESPMKLFYHLDQPEEDSMVLEFASLLMGSAMLHQIQDSLLPLSQPNTTLDLSVPLGKMTTKKITNVQNKSPKSTKQDDHGSVNRQQQKVDQETIANEGGDGDHHGSADVETVSFKKMELDVEENDAMHISLHEDIAVQKDQEDQGVWDGSVWDATVEPSTVFFRTQHNSPTLSVAAFDYIAVAGRGVRKRRRKIVTKITKHEKVSKSVPSSPASTRNRTKESETEKNNHSPVLDKKERPLDPIKNTQGNKEDLHWADDVEDDGSQGNTKPNEGATDWWNESEEKPKVPEDIPTETEDQKQSEAPVELIVDKHGTWKDEDPAPKSGTGPEKAKKMEIKTKWVEYYEFGGFVTLISLRHFAEERTVYLPFVPKEVSPVIWGDMQFLFVLGDEEESDRVSSPMAVAIRVDASGVTKVPCGEAPFFDTLSRVKNQQEIDLLHVLRKQDSISGGIGDELDEKEKAMCSIRRFQPIPVALPIGDEAMAANVLAAPVAVSSAFVDPPSIAVLYSTLQGNNVVDDPSDSDTVVALHTLRGLSFAANAAVAPRSIGRYRRIGLESRGRNSKILTVQTAYQPGHLARVPCRIRNRENADNLWFCHIGQGWSLVGIERRVFFICWEGATEAQGAFVVELDKGSNPILGDFTPCKYSRTISSILPLHTLFPDQILRKQEIESPSFDPTKSVVLNLPFTSPYRMPSMRWMNSGPSGRTSMRPISIGGAHDVDLPPPPLIPVPNVSFVDNESVAGSASAIDGVVVQALDSISNLDYSDMGPTLTPTVPKQTLMLDKDKSLSKREKSRRLLRHCSSWTQLESSQENRAALGGQVPIVSVRLGTKLDDHFVLTLRRTFVENGIATPFNQVLSWLCQRKEYFCAASIGLDLLGDVDGLRDLRRSIDSTELAEGRANLEGLLDGIVPLDFSVENSSNGKLLSRMVESTITQLADMTVGCLVKGGLAMSNTLEGLLGRNVNYDPARASLMLSAAATCAVSGDNDLVSTVMGTAIKEKEIAKAPATDILWPIRCLLRIAVARDFLPTALLLLNESIPDELRNRKRLNEPASTPTPSLEFCASIITMIVASSPNAAGRLLELIDEQTRTRYWESLAHDTQLALALIQIDGKFPLLRESEIRSWALQHLHGCIEADSKKGSSVVDPPNNLPSDWLKKLVDACARNAGCDLKQLSNKSPFSKEDTDGIQKHLGELQMTQNALVSGPGSGGLDFDLIIPALLLLESRDGTLWKDGVLVSTQAILDAACYLAGRHGAEEPAFPFDASTVMRQCALVDNVSAGANLIGGKDGLVLKCCDVLIEGCKMSMDEAESFILDEELSLPKENAGEEKERDFVITDGHRHVLWLLDEHVLSIKTFGEFETIHIRGRVDPVFASHACFRTWLRLNPNESATEWLVSWLRKQLGIDDSSISKKRLACAAIARALMWPSNRKGSIDPDINAPLDQVLATALGIKGKFLVQISQACCGLIEAIPPSLADDVFRHDDHGDVGLGTHVQVGV